jgi:ATP-dependent RNA helicase MSS116
MGFQKSMEYILSHKKKNDTTVQTLLFSATLPPDLRSIMASHMRRNYLTVDCVKDVDPATHTNANVDQSYVTLPPPSGKNNESRYISGLVDIIEDIIHVTNTSDYKIVVFFPTTAVCEFFAYIFNTIYKVPVLEIHSRKAQSNRTMISDKFRKLPKGILFTTDVSARGVDYPNVTHVIQFGSAENRETYIHRLGRTGRAGKVGRGIIICGTLGEEKQFVHRELKGLTVRNDSRYQKLLNGEVVVTDDKAVLNACIKRKEINTERLNKIMTGIGSGSDTTLQKMGNNVYRSLLGYNMTKMSNLGVRSKEEVVQYVNSCAVQLGYSRGMPRISPKVAQTLGLMGVNGVNVGVDYSGGSGSSNAVADGGNDGGRGGVGQHYYGVMVALGVTTGVEVEEEVVVNEVE